MNLDIYLSRIPKQSVEGTPYSPLSTDSKIQEKRDELKKELLTKRNQALT